ncbi:hypothetical protein [Mycobacterium paraense]|nr:hypothetical protein [Mycobacterium paraense]
MTKAWLMMGGGFVLACAGLPAMLDWSRYWWCSALFVPGFALLAIGRRRHDLLMMARAAQQNLEHQLDASGSGAGVAGSQPPLQANPAPGTRSRKPAGAVAWIGVVFAMILAFVGLRVAVQGVLPEALDSGTPATATVVSCVPRESQGIKGYRCDVRWTVNGVSRTGPFHPTAKWGGGWVAVERNPLPVGSQLDVHVRGGSAYQPANLALDVALIAGGLALIAAGVVLYLYLRRIYSSR